jgi:hypothetical protein
VTKKTQTFIARVPSSYDYGDSEYVRESRIPYRSINTRRETFVLDRESDPLREGWDSGGEAA